MHDATPQTRHETTDGESLNVDNIDVDTQGRGAAHVLRSSPEKHSKFRSIHEGPKEDRGDNAGHDDQQIVRWIQRFADGEASKLLE